MKRIIRLLMVYVFTCSLLFSNQPNLLSNHFLRVHAADAEQATELTLDGQQIDAQLTEEEKEHWYKVNLPSDGYLTVTWSVFLTDQYGIERYDRECEMTVYDASADKTYQVDKSEGYSDESDTIFLDSGMYLIKVTSRDSGKYWIKASFEAGNNNDGHDNVSFDTALEVNPNSTVNGFLSQDYHDDYYKVVLPTDGTFKLQLACDRPDRPLICLDLYDTDQTKTLSQFEIFYSNETPTTTIALDAGTYWIKVYNTYSHAQTNKYQLVLEFEDAENDDGHDNISVATASWIQPGQIVHGFLSASNYQDYYKFQLSKPMVVTFHRYIVSSHQCDLNILEYLPDYTSTQAVYPRVGEDPHGHLPGYVTDTVYLTAGTYFIQIIYGSGKYTLSYSVADPVSFSDVDWSTPHHEDIQWMADAQLSTGWKEPNGSYIFRGMDTVKRQDMAAFLRREAIRLEIPDAKTWIPSDDDWNRFSDVNKNTPHAEDILWLAQSGITTGYSDGTYRGMDPVYRQDMAAFLHRLANKAGINLDVTPMPFSDVNADTPHSDDIGWLGGTKISIGYYNGNGTFRYEGMTPVYRQDMAAFLHRLDNKY